MQYMGGKKRIGARIAEVLKRYREDGQTYIEPFIGVGSVIRHMDGIRQGSDINLDLILLLKGLRDGTFIPPMELSEAKHKQLKHSTSSPLRAFAGFGCSFGGKWFRGYARNGIRNYALGAYNELLKLQPYLVGIDLSCKSYDNLAPYGDLVYCDPPYRATSKFACGSFDHEKFWYTMRMWSENNTVIISEYTAPKDFECIATYPVKSTLSSGSITANVVEEKLWTKKQ